MLNGWTFAPETYHFKLPRLASFHLLQGGPPSSKVIGACYSPESQSNPASSIQQDIEMQSLGFVQQMPYLDFCMCIPAFNPL